MARPFCVRSHLFGENISQNTKKKTEEEEEEEEKRGKMVRP
jgi:hypothetical protein